MSRTVGVYALGGTIAMTPSQGGAAGSAVTPTLSAEDLVTAVPGFAATGIDVQVHDVRQLPSGSLGFADLYALSDLVQAHLAAGTIGAAVITQGTDTIEETSWLLDLLYPHQAPVVVTGAMRSPNQAGADGPANLLAALQVADAEPARGLGVLVVMNDEIHAARTVRKAHSTSVAAFTSPDAGPVGRVSENCVTIWREPARPGESALSTPTAGAGPAPRVAVLAMTLGQDDGLLSDLGRTLDGLVIAGFGLGHVPAGLVEPLTRLAARIPVVLASRTGAGPVGSSTYGYPGSESDLLARGLIRAGYLGPYKARVLLHLLLANGAGPGRIRDVFADLA